MILVGFLNRRGTLAVGLRFTGTATDRAPNNPVGRLSVRTKDILKHCEGIDTLQAVHHAQVDDTGSIPSNFGLHIRGYPKRKRLVQN